MENRHILFVCNGFRKTDVGIDLIANAFRGSIQKTKLFSIFSLFIFCFIIYLFEKRTGAYSCLPSKDSLNYSLSLFIGWFLFSTKYTTQNLLRITFSFNDLMLKTNRLKKDFFIKIG